MSQKHIIFSNSGLLEETHRVCRFLQALTAISTYAPQGHMQA